MSEKRAVSGWNLIGLAMLALVPGVVLYLGGFEVPDPIRALLFGITIIGAAFLLSWAAEVVQMDFSQSLALALLALIAILPEYIVDATFAWLAAEDPAYAGYAVANMTGANRLLIGIAWPLVVLLVFLRFRRRFIELEEGHGFELVVLLAATLYAFILPFKGSISLIDLAFLGGLFVFYMWRIARIPVEQPHLVGPARLIGELSPYLRRTVTAIMALVAAAAILLVAKPFATSLVATGVNFGIDEFLLVQWLAPLASESPEFVVVALFAWRGAATPALGTLVSSKINQWTLLVAMLPLVYSIALGAPDALPLDSRQREEVFLTAAQSLFAVALLLDLRLSLIGAGVLFILFVVQAAVPEIRLIVSIIYLVFAVIALIISRHHILNAFRWARPKEAQPGED
jgi:cation:H+ antiporter